MRYLVLAFLLLATPAWGTVVVEGSNSGGVTGGSSVSFSVQCGTNSNRIIMGLIAINDEALVSSSVTYNGSGLSLKKRQVFTTHANTAEVWYLVGATSGSNTLAFTLSGSTNGAAVGVCISGIDQSSPLGTEGFSTATAESISDNVTGVTSGIIIDLLSKHSSATTATVGAGQTQQQSVENGDVSIRAQVSTSTETGTVAMDWTNTGDPSYLNHIAVPLNPATNTRRPIAPMIFQ